MKINEGKGSELNSRKDIVKRAHLVKGAIDGVVLLSFIAFFIQYTPAVVLNALPATGGDTGSHFWPLFTLFEYGFPNLEFRLWNPGNLSGEPHLVHYFPLPFIIMGLLGFFMPLGTAFNVGSLLPLAILPHAVYFCFRKMKAPFPVPILAATASFFFVFNESYSMLGGNTLSTLAGQFAHGYAFVFFFIAMGFMVSDLNRNKISFGGILFISATALSHAYVFLIIPIFMGVAVFTRERVNWIKSLKIQTVNGLASLLLSVWFVYPMIDNNKWTTPLPMYWGWSNVKSMVFSEILYPAYGLAALSLLFIVLPRFRLRLRSFLGGLMFWVIPSLAYFGLFFVFPKLGLVDARAVPQIMVYVIVLGGAGLGWFLRIYLKSIGTLLLTLPIVVASFWWIDSYVYKFPIWNQWNYSGWQSKRLYKDLQAISKEMGSGFSRPRVAFEHNGVSNGAGTIRVFEMLPYHAGRSTTESLYTQATIVAPHAFYLQAKVSMTPSCPFIHFRCPQRDYKNIQEHFSLLGVDSFVAITEEIKERYKSTGLFDIGEAHGPWTLYTLKKEVSLSEVLAGKAKVLGEYVDWRKRFYSWFDQYNAEGSPWLFVKGIGDSEKLAKAIEPKPGPSCKNRVDVDFFGFTLHTDCPGTPHLVKFAYHSTWRASTGDPIALISPGFIATIPSEEVVRFDFGKALTWRISNWFSILGFLILCGVRLRRKDLFAYWDQTR